MTNIDVLTKIIRVDKANSSFVYFTLESNEGIAFHSTLRESLKMPYRDIEINYTESTKTHLLNILKNLEEKFSIEYL